VGSAERARADCPRPFPKSTAVLLSGWRAALRFVSAVTSEPRIDESVPVAIGARFQVERSSVHHANHPIALPKHTRTGDQTWSGPGVFLFAGKREAEVEALHSR
jgi:hypothetical protein